MTELPIVRWKDRVLTLAAWGIAAGVALGFGLLLADVLSEGLRVLSWDFLWQAPRDAGRAGGISTILVSTLAILLVCLAGALPLGLSAAIYLAELGRSSERALPWIRASLDLLAAVPSIVFGLFGAVFFGEVLGFGFSILSGGLTLACMVLPILVRSVETALRAVPAELRQAAAALGFSQRTTLLRILLPSALPGVGVGLVLGIGRALAETAALIFTSGYVTRMPSSLLDSGRSLSVHIYDLAMNVPGGERAAYGTALVLLVILLVTNSVARWMTEGLRRLGRSE